MDSYSISNVNGDYNLIWLIRICLYAIYIRLLLFITKIFVNTFTPNLHLCRYKLYDSRLF